MKLSYISISIRRHIDVWHTSYRITHAHSNASILLYIVCTLVHGTIIGDAVSVVASEHRFKCEHVWKPKNFMK